MTPAQHVLSEAEGAQRPPSSKKKEFALRAWRLGGKDKFSFEGDHKWS
jgi:hypothetical protein